MSGVSSLIQTLVFGAVCGLCGFFYAHYTIVNGGASLLQMAASAPSHSQPPAVQAAAAVDEPVQVIEDPLLGYGLDYANALFDLRQDAVFLRMHTNGAARKNYTSIFASSLNDILVAGRAKFGRPYVTVYGDNGNKVTDFKNLRSGDNVYVARSEEIFFWPLMEEGETLEFYHTDFNGEEVKTTMTMVSEIPRIFSFENFMSAAEADHIVQQADERMAPSTVVHYEKDSHLSNKDKRRTSSSTFMPHSFDEKFAIIENHCYNLSKIPADLSEQIQVIRYQEGQKYEAHFDYFDPAYFPNHPEYPNGINRMGTLLYYLTDVAKGGETGFPRAGGLPVPSDFGDCSRGIAVPPKKGNAVLFYSMTPEGHPDGELDVFSLHGGCMVHEGEKWAANKWYWNKRSSVTKVPRAA